MALCWLCVTHDRHVGDLGNVQPDDEGVVMETRDDKLISLFGTNNIMGRVADVSSTAT